jgi:hypothetical protein
MAQAFKLGEDEPHPVGLLTSFGKFLRDLVMDVRLSVQEANEVSIGHVNLRPVGSPGIMCDAGLCHERAEPISPDACNPTRKFTAAPNSRCSS